MSGQAACKSKAEVAAAQKAVDCTPGKPTGSGSKAEMNPPSSKGK